MTDLSTVAHLRMLGDEEGARELFDTLNRINAAWGRPAHAYPAPERQLTGLVIAPADKVSPTEFLEAVTGLPPRADLQPKELPNGRFQVAA